MGHLPRQRLRCGGPKAGVLDAKDLAKSQKFLKSIKPMKAVLRPELREELNGTNVKKGKNEVRPGRADCATTSASFKKRTSLDRLVMVWCGSTEIFMKAQVCTRLWQSFEKAMKANHAAIAPSMLYAYAAIKPRSFLRQRRAEPKGGYSRASRNSRGKRGAHRRQGFQDRPDPHEDRSRARASRRACWA